MYETEHRFFASALVVSLIACVAFSAALSLAPTQKAYAASGYTEVQLLEYINNNMESLLRGLGMYGENTSSTHPNFRWFKNTLDELNETNWYIYDNTSYINNRLNEMKTIIKNNQDSLIADSIEINGQVRTTVRNYARLAAEHTDSMTTILQAWNRDMGASLNGSGTDATWFSTLAARVLSLVNFTNAMNNNVASISSRLFDYFVLPTHYDLESGDTVYTPAYYLQYSKMLYDDLYKMLMTNSQISVNGTNYKTPHYYLDRIHDYVVNIDYYVKEIYDLLSENLTGSIGGNVSVDMTATNQILNQIKSLLEDIKSLLAPELPNVADAVIGDFDTDGFDENMSTLKDDLASLAVFGSVYSLGLYVATMDDVNAIQAPVLVVPFEFAGSDDVVTLDFTWLDDIRPMINYVLLFSLFIGLTTWSINLIKE